MILALFLGCPAPSGRAAFEQDVVPVLDRSCGSSSCHGVPAGEEDLVNSELFYYPVDSSGRVLDIDAAYSSALNTANTLEPEHSPLLRKPLATAWGGQPHFGGENFRSPSDAEYAAVLAWIETEPVGGADPEPLSELEQRFADDVQPVLVGMTCLNASCHGVDAAVPLRFDGGIEGWIGIEGTRANHAAARGMLALDGDGSQSRLLRKALPLHDGGVLHRGGNDVFLSGLDDARAQAVVDWACAERLAETGADCGTEPDAFVFVQGPVVAEDMWDLDAWNPGTDLVLATLDGVVGENLTDGLHDDPADVRAPAVDPSGTRVLFTMRESEDTGHAVWLLELDTGEAQQLTWPDGWNDRDPAWGEGGNVWFVSDRDGTTTDAGGLDPELYELTLETGSLQRRTWTPHAERKPTWYAIGAGGHEVAFTALRAAVPDQAVAHAFRFPPSLVTEYHQHYGVTAPEDVLWDTRELADGRFITLLGDLDNRWTGGRPAVLDRNMGTGIPADAAVQEPGIPGFVDPLTRLDEDAAALGVTTLYRDAAPLPDGRLLWARSQDPMDLADETETPVMVIELVELVESPDGTGPSILSTNLLVEGTDPEPVVVRPTPPAEEPAWDPEATTALLLHNGLPMIDALLYNLAASGPKTVLDELVGVRLIEALDVERTVLQDGETSTGIPERAPARVLAELPLAADGSFQVELPAGVAVRVQGLDADGMAIGADHNRWLDFAPGQVMRQGIGAVDSRHFTARCAACHGSLDGDPSQVFIAPDVMTTASLTLSRYEQSDPRRPIPAPVVDDDTRIHVDFVEDVQPVLQARCASCHDEGDPTLTDTPTDAYDQAYESLVGGGWVGNRARDSELTQVLEDGHGELTEDEWLTLVRWMDIGAPWTGRP
ncbi:MAG: hypothetical protein GY913_17895 [Proteobacteria bacterium]|nr:hypothetical protein [Pseudomonadota bacterium]MCP4918780.1 hypothetical protein [Pseudomonadota bacterium]